jgi:4-hydroxy-3-methylbut-2-enyl diphosphate reductase
MAKPHLTLLLASPRGFCAGVDRAVQIVEKALERYGAPVYVRHEIVHNRAVVTDLESRGAVFVDSLDDVPLKAPVVFSAHGVPKSVYADAERRGLFHIDATCPLVSKVHRGAERHHEDGREVVLIGHAGHPEVIGTLGQLEEGEITLIGTVAEAETFSPRDPERLAYATQTTLAVDDTAEIVSVLRRRFPSIAPPHKEDICYATTNRQDAVRAIAPRCDAIAVIGAANSSNSVRLTEVAARAGCARTMLVAGRDNLDWNAFDGATTVGVTAGASAPERLVEEVVEAFRERFKVSLETVTVTSEDMRFRLPRVLEEQ